MKLGSIIRFLVVPAAACALTAVYALEKKRPLRAPVGSKRLRTGRNLAIAATAAGTMYLLEKPVAERVASLVERKNIAADIRSPRSSPVCLIQIVDSGRRSKNADASPVAEYATMTFGVTRDAFATASLRKQTDSSAH